MTHPEKTDKASERTCWLFSPGVMGIIGLVMTAALALGGWSLYAIDSLQSKAMTNKTRLDDHSTQMVEVKSCEAEIQNKISTIQADLAEIKTDIKWIRNRNSSETQGK